METWQQLSGRGDVMLGQLPTPRRQVGPYEIYRSIGRGGMAVVHLARQSTLDRDVALKELSSFHAESPEFAARFRRESKLTGSLNHPNIVTVYEYLEHGGVHYIAMEYIPCGSLRRHVGRLSFAQLIGVMEGILAGLAYAESRGIVHRDLKPENILVTEEGLVKIGDFGIAKATQLEAPPSLVTVPGATVGTPSYMAPEQAMAMAVGPWTDLYSLGIMAWEHAVGRVPFHDVDEPWAILMHHVNDEIPSAVKENADTDPDFSEWLDRLLVKDPVNRTARASTAWDELEEIAVRKLGALWRRGARLPTAAVIDEPPRITPAQVDSPRPPTPEPPLEGRSSDSTYLTFGRSGEPVLPLSSADVPSPIAPREIAISGEKATPADQDLEPEGVPTTEHEPEASALSRPPPMAPEPGQLDEAPASERPHSMVIPDLAEASPPAELNIRSEPDDVIGGKLREPVDATPAGSRQLDSDPALMSEPAAAPSEQAHPPAAADRRRRRLSWLSLPLVAAISAGGVVTLLQQGGSSPRQSTSLNGWQKFTASSGAYKTVRPVGWSVPCNDLAVQCESNPVPAGVHETRITDGPQLIVIDRQPATPNLQDLSNLEQLGYARYGGYQLDSYHPIVVASKRTWRFEFRTNGQSGNPGGGVVYTFRAGAEDYIVAGLSLNEPAAYVLATRATEALSPHR